MWAEKDSLLLDFSFSSSPRRLNIGLAVLKCVSKESNQLSVCMSMSWMDLSTSLASCLEGKIRVLSLIRPLSLAASWLSSSLGSACCSSIMLALTSLEPRKNTANSFVKTLYLTGVAPCCRGSGLRLSRIFILLLSLFRFSVVICRGPSSAYL